MDPPYWDSWISEISKNRIKSRISAPVKKPLALEMQDNDLKAMTAALNQIFRQDEEFRQLQKRNENEYKDLISIFPTIFGLL